MTNQPTNPEPAIEIDYREVARRVTRMMEALLVSPEVLFPSVESTAQAWEHWSEQAEWMLRAEQTYLASKGVTPAEDPRDAEIRELKLDKDTLVRNQIVSLDEMRKLRDLADHWCRRALAAESKPVELPVARFGYSDSGVRYGDAQPPEMADTKRAPKPVEAPKPAEAAPSGRFSYQPENEDELGSILENGKTLVILEESDDKSQDVGAKRIVKLLNAPKPAEAKEPTRTERLVRFALDAKALDLAPWIDDSEAFPALLMLDFFLSAAEAAAVRAALEEA